MTIAVVLALLLQSAASLPLPPSGPVEPDQIEGPLLARDDDGPVTRIVLKNGLTAILREQSALPVAAIATYVKAGAVHENPAAYGTAVLTGRLLLRGTQKSPGGALLKEMRGLGGDIRSEVTLDHTLIQSTMPSAALARALEIQADILTHPRLDPADLQVEAQTLAQWIRHQSEDTLSAVWENFFETAFRSHRARIPVTGRIDSIGGVDSEAVRTFYSARYVPANVIVSIAGKFERDAMIEQIVNLYGSMESREVAPPAAQDEDPQTEARYAWVKGTASRARALIAYRVPGVASTDHPALEVLQAILGQGADSIIQRVLRDDPLGDHSDASSLTQFGDFGVLGLSFETSDTALAVTTVLSEIERIRRNGVSPANVARAKALLTARHFKALEGVATITEDLARLEGTGGWKQMDVRLDLWMAVTPADVQRVADAYCSLSRSVVVEYLPRTVERTWSVSDYQAAVLGRVKPAEAPEFAESAGFVPPRPTESVSLDLVRPMRRFSILRGPEVFVAEDRRLPLVSFGLFYPGGRLYESAKSAGITELTLRSAMRGTRRHTAEDIRRELDAAGARIQVINEPDFFGYVVEGLAGNMTRPLELLVEILQNPAFPEDEVLHEQRSQLDRLDQMISDRSRSATAALYRSLYEDSPYGRPRDGTVDAVRSLNRNDLEAWFRQNQRPLLPTIVIVGDTRGSELAASVAEALTNEDLHARDTASLPSPRLRESGVETSIGLPGPATSLLFGFPGAAAASADRFGLLIVNYALSGLAGRASEVLSAGLSSSIESDVSAHGKSGALWTIVRTDPATEAQVREQFLKEVERLRRDGLNPEELRSAVNQILGAQQLRFQMRTSQAIEYASTIMAGGNPNSIRDLPQELRRLTPELVKSMAGVYLDPRKMRVIRVEGGAGR